MEATVLYTNGCVNEWV